MHLQLASSVHGTYHPVIPRRLLAVLALRHGAAAADAGAGYRRRHRRGRQRAAGRPGCGHLGSRLPTNTVVLEDVDHRSARCAWPPITRRHRAVIFANSRWTFDGNVQHADADQSAASRSDAAVVEFKDNHIARATATGKPAEFQQTARGRARARARGRDRL